MVVIALKCRLCWLAKGANSCSPNALGPAANVEKAQEASSPVYRSYDDEEERERSTAAVGRGCRRFGDHVYLIIDSRMMNFHLAFLKI